MLGFDNLQQRLLSVLLHRVRNGEFTERALASRAGISQPHLHNMLKGARSLNSGAGDRVLASLGLSVIDLLDAAELRRGLFLRARSIEDSLEVPVLRDRMGPGMPCPEEPSPFERVKVPMRALSRIPHPVVARACEDPAMTPVLNSGDLVLLDRSREGRLSRDTGSLYVVRRGGCAEFRWLRPGRRGEYVLSARSRDRPECWEATKEPRLDFVLARAIPLNWIHPPELVYDPLLQPRDIHREPARPYGAS